MKLDRLSAMLNFVRIVECGSLSQAARDLGKTLPALSRSLKTLEERLGTRLLTRTTRVITLTESGQQYYEQCRRILQDIDEAEGLASETGRAPQGLVRISAPLLFGRLHVAPLVAPLLASHTKLQVDLQLNDRIVSMVDEGVDISIRIGDLDDSSLVAIPLGKVTQIVCAAPHYWSAWRKPRQPADLKEHRCLALRGMNQERGWLFSVENKERHWPIVPACISNDGAALIQIAREGGGIIQMMSYQVSSDIAKGKLVRVLDKYSPHPLPVQLVYPGGRLLPAKVRAVLDHLTPALRNVLK